MTEPITGAVARIINGREVAINRGEAAGVREGMIFEILDPLGLNVVDPETGEDLGSVPLVKARVRVTTVSEKLCVARTYRTTRKNIGGSASNLSGMVNLQNMLSPPKWVEEVETLHADPKDTINPEQSKVDIGDPVQQVLHPND